MHQGRREGGDELVKIIKHYTLSFVFGVMIPGIT